MDNIAVVLIQVVLTMQVIWCVYPMFVIVNQDFSMTPILILVNLTTGKKLLVVVKTPTVRSTQPIQLVLQTSVSVPLASLWIQK